MCKNSGNHSPVFRNGYQTGEEDAGKVGTAGNELARNDASRRRQAAQKYVRRRWSRSSDTAARRRAEEAERRTPAIEVNPNALVKPTVGTNAELSNGDQLRVSGDEAVRRGGNAGLRAGLAKISQVTAHGDDDQSPIAVSMRKLRGPTNDEWSRYYQYDDQCGEDTAAANTATRESRAEASDREDVTERNYSCAHYGGEGARHCGTRK
ncbi:hypothetical protein GN958_ATG14787 [Phytophthora infestans]|uniref:Uncharacterized protein n=1 Tax=Phytophthora infestans TaxID=4787 RepID=A0A8S9U515_PHYIN|nr:hypothetical protein GN958_ATG14787 [Phytophthora infestans]